MIFKLAKACNRCTDATIEYTTLSDIMHCIDNYGDTHETNKINIISEDGTFMEWKYQGENVTHKSLVLSEVNPDKEILCIDSQLRMFEINRQHKIPRTRYAGHIKITDKCTHPIYDITAGLPEIIKDINDDNITYRNNPQEYMDAILFMVEEGMLQPGEPAPEECQWHDKSFIINGKNLNADNILKLIYG